MNTRFLATAGFTITLFLFACGNADNKKQEKEIQRLDSVTVNLPDSPAPETPVKKAPKADSGPGDVLARIDEYLITIPSFDAPAAGAEGISNGQVAVHNKLTNTSFQKAIIEVSILQADGREFRTDYYTVVNLEPGDRKMVRIPNTTRGIKVTSRVVKVKSNELTKGESVTVGNGYVPK